ncbi:subclass B3 metallo-beta-lactamase [Novosphingobium sp. M1R2S20]|uniref:Subclass B3 metallo-beta-lactamase n=1 Tax=Novosphingobium rhizovicinum TaxID=3228928 RepID=A0ABV3REP3_9SPHN
MKRARTTLAISLAAIGSLAASSGDDPLLRPIAAEYAQRWLTPQAPKQVFGNTYAVGFGGLSVALIRTSAGLILVDGAVPQAVPDIEANLRRLGFSIRDVKLILSTEPHYDHAGGIAALARDSGATVIASPPAAAVLQNGGADPDDPQASTLARFPAIDKVRAVRNGEQIRLGDVAVTAVASPGHTEGSMSWQWRSCEGKDCATVVFASSLNPVASGAWRFSDHPERVTMFRNTFARFRTMPCDILLTAHPDASGAIRSPRNGSACRAYADEHEILLNRKLRAEQSPG